MKIIRMQIRIGLAGLRTPHFTPRICGENPVASEDAGDRGFK